MRRFTTGTVHVKRKSQSILTILVYGAAQWKTQEILIILQTQEILKFPLSLHRCRVRQ
jgi:hypothetical protein